MQAGGGGGGEGDGKWLWWWQVVAECLVIRFRLIDRAGGILMMGPWLVSLEDIFGKTRRKLGSGVFQCRRLYFADTTGFFLGAAV